MITDADIARIADAVVARMADTPQKMAVSAKELAARLGTGSRSATHRMIGKLGLRSVGGKYRVRDVDNALAREARNQFAAASRLAGAGRPGDRRIHGQRAGAQAGGGETP